MTSIIKVDTVQDQDGNNIISENANTITIGASGDTISIPAGATLVNSGTATGFGLTTQSVQTTGFTAVKGNLYPCNTTSAAFTVTLPASASVGDQLAIVDYAGTFATNNITLGANGNKINGSTLNRVLNTTREGVIITYIDSTQGWVATSGVNEGTVALAPAPYSVDFLVIAGGAGAVQGGGGAGGYRSSNATYGGSGGGGSAESSITFNVGTVYTVTVGAGGAGRTTGSTLNGADGSISSISGTGITTITSAGGGGGNTIGNYQPGGNNGGSGGGAGAWSGGLLNGGSGTANQGYAGGSNGNLTASPYGSGGGGGAGAVGASASAPSARFGNGGNGVASTITGTSVTRGGGGGAGSYISGESPVGTGGTGGGGNGSSTTNGSNGTANTGGGGGGTNDSSTGGSGGSGVVILRIPTANYSGTTTGSPTVTTSGSDTILVFNSSGSITG